MMLSWWLRGKSICSQCGRPGFDPWVRKIPWRRKWQPTPVSVPGESHGKRSLVDYSPRAHKELDMTEEIHFHSHDAVKVMHSIRQQIWKTQQWPQDWKRSVFIPIPKKGNPKECSNYCTVALISHTSKVMLKILQARLQQYVNCELPDF